MLTSEKLEQEVREARAKAEEALEEAQLVKHMLKLMGGSPNAGRPERQAFAPPPRCALRRVHSPRISSAGASKFPLLRSPSVQTGLAEECGSSSSSIEPAESSRRKASLDLEALAATDQAAQQVYHYLRDLARARETQAARKEAAMWRQLAQRRGEQMRRLQDAQLRKLGAPLGAARPSGQRPNRTPRISSTATGLKDEARADSGAVQTDRSRACSACAARSRCRPASAEARPPKQPASPVVATRTVEAAPIRKSLSVMFDTTPTPSRNAVLVSTPTPTRNAGRRGVPEDLAASCKKCEYFHIGSPAHDSLIGARSGKSAASEPSEGGKSFGSLSTSRYTPPAAFQTDEQTRLVWVSTNSSSRTSLHSLGGRR